MLFHWVYGGFYIGRNCFSFTRSAGYIYPAVLRIRILSDLINIMKKKEEMGNQEYSSKGEREEENKI